MHIKEYLNDTIFSTVPSSVCNPKATRKFAISRTPAFSSTCKFGHIFIINDLFFQYQMYINIINEDTVDSCSGFWSKTYVGSGTKQIFK